jgi:DNA polymerase III subunit delta'
MKWVGPHIERVEAGLDPLLAEGRLPHALLISGPRGVGKRSLTHRLARGLLCSTFQRTSGCGSCGSCQRVDLGEHPDLHILERPVGKTKIPVADVRSLLEALSRASLEGRGRVALLSGVEDLGTEGQNALLKTLEEPFPGTWLLLTTSRPETLLDTVRSRVHRLGLPPLGAEDMRAFLSLVGTGELGLEDLLAVAEGSPGRALELSAGNGLAALEHAERLFEGRMTEQAWAHMVFEGISSGDEGVRQAKKMRAHEILALSLQLARRRGHAGEDRAWTQIEIVLEALRDLDLGLSPEQVLQALHRQI